MRAVGLQAEGQSLELLGQRRLSINSHGCPAQHRPIGHIDGAPISEAGHGQGNQALEHFRRLPGRDHDLGGIGQQAQRFTFFLVARSQLRPFQALGQGIGQGGHERHLGLVGELATAEREREQPEDLVADDQRRDVAAVARPVVAGHRRVVV